MLYELYHQISQQPKWSIHFDPEWMLLMEELLDMIVGIDPLDSPLACLPIVKARGVNHEWLVDTLSPIQIVPEKVGIYT